MAVATIHRLEQLFRRAAGLDLDTTDLDRPKDFVRGEANAAKANDPVQVNLSGQAT